jgi:RNA polymerase sigma-70 factor (ECF subfamily)
LLEKFSGGEEPLLARLRSGDETAFAALVDELHGRLLALAGTFTSSPALGEDIVQETWLAVIRGLRRFEARSSIRTWIFSILVRRARTLATREARRAEVRRRPDDAALEGSSAEWEPGRGRLGLWEEPPVPWGLEDPASVFQTREALEVVQNAVAGLPQMQQQVVFLRDVEGVGAEDVCNVLEISETNQRVLLHRGRARIQRALDHYLRDGGKPPVRGKRDDAGAAAASSDGSTRRREKES